MPRPAKLSSEECLRGSASLPDWSVIDGKLHREYKFPDFTHAFGFMAAVATVAEKMDHHPDWSNVYNRVTVDLSTHDAGGITELDFQLARSMENDSRETAMKKLLLMAFFAGAPFAYQNHPIRAAPVPVAKRASPAPLTCVRYR